MTLSAPPPSLAPELLTSDASGELPVHLTGFIGRARELAELVRLLESVRLLTLTGAGGSGKTRLAREVATRVAPLVSRIAWVDLAPVAEPELIPGAIAAALHIREQVSLASLDRIVAAIGGESLLLVLDNCEHLVDACAETAEHLLRGCPSLSVLATSREALGVGSETAWLVPRLDDREAIQLFVERAQATQPSFALTDANTVAVREICRRLDGIPLAIELAAARIRVLTPEQIAARLDDAFRLLTAGSRTALARHRTLRGTMDWSYALLTPREQALLRRLAIFHGGFSLEGAESVCVDEDGAADSPVTLEADDVLDGVAALVDKSLVTMEAGEGAARYHLLETVRQYAMERLVASGEIESVRARHAGFYLQYIESVAPRLVGGEHEAGLLARLALDHENLRIASAWAAADPSRAAAALRFADTLFWYYHGTGNWLRTGRFTEVRQYIIHAITTGANEPAMLRGRALAALGLTTLAQGDYDTSRAAFEEALALLRTVADPFTVTTILSKLGAAHLMLGNGEEAARYLDEANAMARSLPPSMTHAFVYFWDTLSALERNDLDRAGAIHRQSLALGNATAHRTIRAHHAMLHARIELQQGNRDEAAAALREAITTHVAIGDGWGLMVDLDVCASLLAQRGRHDAVARMMGAADTLRERIGIAMLAIDRPRRAAQEAAARGELGHDYRTRYEEGRVLPIDDLVREATDATTTHTAEFRVPLPPAAAPAPAAARERVAELQKPAPTEGPRLRVRALGPLQVLLDDTAIDPSAWGSARPRELLVYLLMHPEGRTKEHVGLAFWPESSAAQLRNNFHVTIHRLRKALGGAAWITLTGDRYSVDASLVAEFDATLFEREMLAARKALKKNEDGATAALEKALERFRGDFLDGEPAGDWHLDHRDRFQRLYVEGLMALGERHGLEGRPSRAAEAFRRVLARDELHEGALMELMRAHARVGERAQAIRVYQRFAERMRKELESEPDEDAQELLEAIQRGEGV